MYGHRLRMEETKKHSLFEHKIIQYIGIRGDSSKFENDTQNV